MENFRDIPREILDKILEYDGRIKRRNGVYMTQITKDDTRYPLLRNIPKKEFYGFSLSVKRGITDNSVYETFVYFRNKHYKNNKIFTIYFIERFEEQSINHYFGKDFLSIEHFILP